MKIGDELHWDYKLMGMIKRSPEIVVHEGKEMRIFEDVERNKYIATKLHHYRMITLEKGDITTIKGKEGDDEIIPPKKAKGIYDRGTKKPEKKVSNAPSREKTAEPKGIAKIAQTEGVVSPPAQHGFISPAVTIDQAIETFELFEQAKTRILKDSDVIWLGRDGIPGPKGKGKPHIKRSGWRKLARFFGLSWEILGIEKIPVDETVYLYRCTAKVTHPSGASVTLDGAATSVDPFFTKGGRKKADEENVLMKSETVALNRAISDILGSGEVSAEEMPK